MAIIKRPNGSRAEPADQPFAGAAVTSNRVTKMRPQSLSEPAQVGPSLGTGRIAHRLAAFLALDIKNYSLMISDDESAAHRRVCKDLAIVVNQIHRQGGSIHNFTGDGLLAEFASTRASIQSALQIQTGAWKRNQRRPADQNIEYRIGINAGEIVDQSGSVGGDTVNIAARLEQIAEPGGLCISEAVFAQVHRIVRARYTNIGATRLKNIRYPVCIYRVAVLGNRPGEILPQNLQQGAYPELRDYRPSIAILPFSNLSSDQQSDYFSDGVVEDIIVSLAGLKELRVVSRASTLGYPSGRTDIRAVGSTLDVKYVLSGSIRRSPTVIRAVVELTDTQSGVSIWADAAEFPPNDLFEVQEQLVRHIVGRIAPHIREEELRRALRRRPESMSAYDLTLRAIHLMDYMDKDMFAQARDILRQATDVDPHFAMPVAWSIWWHVIWVGQGWSADPAGDFETAKALAERVATLDPTNSLGLAMAAHLRAFLLHDYDGAQIFFQRALDAGPNNPIAIAMHALTLAYLGRGEEAVTRAHQAIRLSPLDHRMFLFHNILAWANFAAANDIEAAKWARASHSASPRFTANLRILIAALAAVGSQDEARAGAAALLKLEPDFSVSRYVQTIQPYHDPVVRARFLNCLRSIGLPE